MAFLPTNPGGWSPGDEITSDQMNDLDTKTVAAIDGVNGGSYACPIEFTNCTELDMNGPLNLNNSAILTSGPGSAIWVANSGTFQVFSGGAMLLSDGASVTVGADITYQSTHAATYQSGSSISYNGTSSALNGSTHIFGSGATLSQSLGSTFNFGGTQNFSGGGTTTFSNTPSFSAGFNVNGGTATFGASSIINLAGTATVTGASNRLKLTPRAITKFYSPSTANPDYYSFNGGTDSSPAILPSTGLAILKAWTGASQSLVLTIQAPNNSVMTSVRATWNGSGSTVRVEAFRTTSSLGFVQDSVSGTKTIVTSETIDNSTHTYRLVVTRVSGPDITWIDASATFVVSEYAEG